MLLTESAPAQTYREWRDSTLPDMREPRRVSDVDGFPIGMFVYAYDFNRPFWELTHYMKNTGIDHMIHGVRKDYDGYRNLDNWDRYLELLDSLEATNTRLVPLIDYGGWQGLPSYVAEAEHGREILFYPFDSSQMRRWEVHENVFTSYQFSSTQENPLYPHSDTNDFREAVYETSLANQTIASGIAFDYEAGQTIRWDQTWNGSVWTTVAAADRINSGNLFEHINFAWWNAADNRWEGDFWHTHRAPHYLTVAGHLFEEGAAADADTLLRVDVWFEVDKGKRYRDSSGVEQTADTNLRFLYKSLGVTKEELKPTDPLDPNWNEYREAIKKVDFQREGMGGPTDTLPGSPTQAQRIDLEVVYLGGEKLALRSIGLRDSIANLLMIDAPAGEDYRDAVIRELDTLLLENSSGDLRSSIYNMYVTDEPKQVQFAGFREVKHLIERNFALGTDTMGTLNGWALPYLQWLGNADWLSKGNYLGNTFYNNGYEFGFVSEGDDFSYRDVPSVAQHNGGQWTIPELFDFDSLGSPTYLPSLPGRIDTMELIFQHTRMGAATNEPDIAQKFDDLWRLRLLYQSALFSRDMGHPMQNYLGANPWFRIKFNETTEEYDTIADHRYERSELRLLMRLALAYGARGITFYRQITWPWGQTDPYSTDGHINGHLLFSDAETGLCGFEVADTAYNFKDWAILDPNPGHADSIVGSVVYYDSIGTIPNMYFGFRDTYKELKESLAWMREIGPFMSRLRWRDVYSIHFQADLPGNSVDDPLQHRPLPSDEIVTEVTTWHPATGVVDPEYATYVELGLFETTIDTTGGVRDVMKDTNYVFVVNRRVFETGNYDTVDIPYSSGVKALLDTLSGVRTIKLTFNLGHPDSTQYAFIRVREVLPDTTELPFIGIRQPLDTVIYGHDSSVVLTLGPGRAALLEITYEPGDESIVDGRLAWNNQRKMIYGFDDRWHAVYLRNDSILYRRSMKAGSQPASILWEPVEILVSRKGPQIRTENWFPSMTMRVFEGDTIVSIVWTCHSLNGAAAYLGWRDVVVRDLNLTDGTRSDIFWIEYQRGRDSTQWGDAVICAAHGGDFIAWGDSVAGVIGVVRRLESFGDPIVLSDTLWVSASTHPVSCGTVGRWPTVPAFAHINSADSNCGIAWNQPLCTGGDFIRYKRLQHTVVGGGGPGLVDLNSMIVSPTAGNLGRPSIDQTQDLWHRVQEGVAWVKDIPSKYSDIYFRSLYTQTLNRPGWDSIEMTQGWDYAVTPGSPHGTNGNAWPNVASTNDFHLPADTVNEALFTVSFVDGVNTFSPYLREARIKYSAASFKTGWPKTYLLDLEYPMNYPQGSASPVNQRDRYGLMYETTLPTPGKVLRTTRQFFGAKERPTGYIADGRELILRMSDTIPTGFTIQMNDIWIADSDGGRPLPMNERDYTNHCQTLSDATGLLRTESFETSDSAEIGVELFARFYGDSGIANNACVDVVIELVLEDQGEVVNVLDSIRLTSASDSVHLILHPEFDLLSDTYFIRTRVDTASLSVVPRTWEPTYPVLEYASHVGKEIASKFVRKVGSASEQGARINAQPNPFGERTEIRFSIPRTDHISITVYDALGRVLDRMLDDELFEQGRYALEFDAATLPAGTYLIELRTSDERVIEKTVLQR